MLLAAPAWAAEDGFTLYRKGDYAKAAEAFGKKAMEQPDVPRWRYNRGVSAARAGDGQTAEGALASSMLKEADPEVRFKSAYNLGTLALEAKNYPEAVSMLTKALAQRPGDPDATYNLGLALWRQKQEEQQKKEQEKKDQEQQSCKNPQQGQEGKSGDKGGQGQQGQQNKDQQQKDQAGQGQEQKDREQGKDQAQQGQEQQEKAGGVGNAPRPEEQDSQGKLETLPGTRTESGEQSPAQQAQAMERIRAEALVNNVKENPARLLFRTDGAEHKQPTSGKDW